MTEDGWPVYRIGPLLESYGCDSVQEDTNWRPVKWKCDMMFHMETWKPVIGHDMYEVSDLGAVRSWKNGKWGRRSSPRLLKQSVGNTGYLRVNLGVARLVHHLVLESHVGPRLEGHEGAHFDGDKTNNRLVNLRWATQKENGEDNARLGVSKGESHGMHKLTNQDVREIRQRWGSHRAMAERYGVSIASVRRVISGRGWTHVK